MLPKSSKDPKLPQYLCPTSLLSTTGKLFEKFILKIVQRHIEKKKGLLNAHQFGFRVHHGITLQRMKLMDHATLNLNNNLSRAAIFLDIEKALDSTWQLGMQYKLSQLKFPISLIQLMSSSLSQRKFRNSVVCEMFTPRDIQAGCHKVPFCPPH
jgi:hypothetical protein